MTFLGGVMGCFSCFSKTSEQRGADFNMRVEELNGRISGDNKGTYAINYTDQSTFKQKTISLSAFMKKVVEINEEYSKTGALQGCNEAKLKDLNAALANKIASCNINRAAGSVDQKRKAASSGRGFLSNFFKLFSRDYWFCDTRYEKFYTFCEGEKLCNEDTSKIAKTFEEQFKDTSDSSSTVSASSSRSNSIALNTDKKIIHVASNSFSNDGSSNSDNTSVESSSCAGGTEIVDLCANLMDDHLHAVNQSFDDVSKALKTVGSARTDKELQDSIKNYFKSKKACEKLVNTDQNRDEIFKWWGICATFLETDQELININLRARLSEKMAFEESSCIDRPAWIEIYQELEKGLKETNTDPKNFFGKELFAEYSKVAAEYEQEWNDAVAMLVDQQKEGLKDVYTKGDAEVALIEEVTRNRCSNPKERAQEILKAAEKYRKDKEALLATHEAAEAAKFQAAKEGCG